MKLSRYNFIKKHGDNTVFFNAVTCALAFVDENFLQAYDDVKNGIFDENGYDSSLIASMKASGCIIEDDVDEIQNLLFYRNLGKYDRTKLSLTIAPTLSCNFRCPYCYEQHPVGIMNQETQDALIGFISSKINVTRTMAVTWYGGEPLLAKDIVYSLSEKILSLCSKQNVKYNASIVTNGSLFREEDVDAFKKYNIEMAQVTIDGPKEIHDVRRRSMSGNSTFDQIINAVNMLSGANIKVVIRINVDRENLGKVDELLLYLKAHIKYKEYVRIDFGKVTSYNGVCSSVENNCYDNKEYADVMLPLFAKVLSLGFTMNRMAIYPSARFNYCCADYVNSYVIDPKGDLYKCWNQVGQSGMSFGSIKEKSNAPHINELKWLLRNPIDDSKCHNCEFLPICMGGCPYEALDDGRSLCDTIKYNFNRVIDFYCDHIGGESK